MSKSNFSYFKKEYYVGLFLLAIVVPIVFWSLSGTGPGIFSFTEGDDSIASQLKDADSTPARAIFNYAVARREAGPVPVLCSGTAARNCSGSVHAR